MTVRPAMMYGLEILALTKRVGEQKQKELELSGVEDAKILTGSDQD